MSARARALIENEDLKGEMMGAQNYWVICNKPGGMIYMATRSTGELYWVGKPEKAGTFSADEAARIAARESHINGTPVLALPEPE